MTTTATEQAAPSPDLLRAQFAADLVARGVLTSPHWQEAFREVPRHKFVSRYTVLTPDGGSQQYDLTDPVQHGNALAAVYRDTPLITQEGASGAPTSSSSEPSMMAMMLEAADLQPGMNVLEIGTGTGYNAALLTHALGASSVTSVGIHPGLTKTATASLYGAGYEPTVICGDGAQGHAGRAPYDRIIATCSVTRIPFEWRAQLKPGGVIVANVGFGLARLTLAADGTLEGPFLDYASFMPMRASVRESAASVRDVLTLAERTTPRQAGPKLPVEERMVTFLRSVIMPGVTHVTEEHPEGSDCILAHPESGSWARALDSGAASVAVSDGGPRSLWTELQEVAEGWMSAGRPPISSYGLTVASDGGHALWVVAPGRHYWHLA